MDTRSAIVEHAFEELSRKGLYRFSLRAVGEAAGLSVMAVYRHFKNKEDLLFAVGEEAFDAFNQLVAAIPDGPIEKWLGKLTRAYVLFALESPGRFDACFIFRTRVERVYPHDFSAGKSPVISVTARRIQAAHGSRHVKREDALELALLMWAQVHGLVMLYRAGRFSLHRDAFLRLCERASQRFGKDALHLPASTRAARKTLPKAGAR
jgi:AcrR family transcriptional regulator